MKPTKYLLNCPELITKTNRNYTWAFPTELEWLKDNGRDKTCSKIIAESLYYNYGKALTECKIDKKFTMKTIRCNYATKWVQKKTENELMGYGVPRNPL